MTSSTPRDNPTGTVIAERYEIIRALGHGAFGKTFLARDRTAERDIAVKLLDPGSADWKARELFEREASVLRTLRHHGIPEVHELVRDVWDGAPALFLVMEYIEGRSLEAVIEEGQTLDPAGVVHLFLEMLGILEYLHGRVPPILHRDIKPSNIIIRPDGQPALVDFGSVRRVFLEADEAGSTVAGTYGYMPYEQYMGQASPSSDLYALAATFLHLLTGRPPRAFMSEQGQIRVPDALPGDARLRPIIATLLRPVPAERFGSARDVRHALLSSQALQPLPNDAMHTRMESTDGAAAHPAHALQRVQDHSTGHVLPTRPSIRTGVDLALLSATPRALEGPTKQVLDRVAYSGWDLMDTTAKPGDEPGALDWFGLVFFSVVTAGVVPIVFFGMARARRRRLKRFLRDGLPGVAEILDIAIEPTAFGEHIARVNYAFEADGMTHRDADRVLPAIAHRWRPGDRVAILYLPGQDYDSVIIGAA